MMRVDSKKVMEGITIQCAKGFQCLHHGEADVCRVLEEIHALGIHVDPEDRRYCQFLFRFPVYCLCICPVRRRLYRLYGI